MKKILLLGSLFLFATIVEAQTNNESFSGIDVIGEAETEVVPDQIYLQITLKEYKKGSKKVTINTLEKQLVNAVSRLDLPKENLVVSNIYGYNWNWKKRKAEDFLATKSFKLLLPDVKKINDLVDLLDEEGVNSMNISEYNHSEMDKIKAELKVKAIKAAKAKAEMLLAAIGQELGKAVYVSENMPSNNFPVQYRSRAFESASYANNESGYTSELKFKKIKLTSQIRVIFSIK